MRTSQGEWPGFWTSLGIGVVGILDAFGLPLIWEAVSGERLFSGRELTDKERGASFANGLIAFFTTLLAIKSVTAAKQVHTAVSSAEKVAAVGDDLARVGGVTDDAARIAGTTDDAARIAGTCSRPAQATPCCCCTGPGAAPIPSAISSRCWR